MTSMLAIQLNHLAADGIVSPLMILRLKEYVSNAVRDKKVVILLNVDVMSTPGYQIGQPQPLEDDGTASGAPAVSFQQNSRAANNNFGGPASNNYGARNFPAAAAAYGDDLNSQPILAVSALNPYQNRWTIKVRVTSKSDLRRYANTRGEGKIFNADLIDEAGTEIRMTFFNEQVDSFNDVLQPGQVYLISRGSVKPANRKFSSIKNEYEITAGSDTSIQPADSGGSIPQARAASYVSIDSILDRPPDDIIDVIGVVHATSDVVNIRSKAGQDLTKRTLTIVDESMRSIDTTLWGDQALGWNAPPSAVVSVKGAKVGDFGGRTLSVLRSSVLEVNPDSRRTIDLRGWYDSNPNHNFTPLTQAFGGGAASRETPHMDCSAADQMVDSGAAVYWANRAWTTKFRYADGATTFYDRCATPDCKRKAVESNGMFNCETCHKQWPDSVPTYVLQLNIADATSSLRISALGDPGIPLMGGRDARVVKAAKNTPEELEAIFEDASFHLFNFKLRSRSESYESNGALQKGIKHNVITAVPVNWVTEGNSILAQLSH